MENTKDTDILVIGAETAGARAAIEAAKHNVRVTLLTKGKDIATSGASVGAGKMNDLSVDSRSICDVLGLDGNRKDTKDIFFRDILRTGGYVNDQSLVEAYVEEVPARAKELIDWGLDYSTRVGHAPGHTNPRGFTAGGVQFIKCLEKVVKQQKNIEIVGNMMALDLLTSKGRVVGALSLDLAGGDFCIFKAKSVIIATGGGQGIYPRRSWQGGNDLTGDGQAMAYRAGAEILDPQYVQWTVFAVSSLMYPPWTGVTSPQTMLLYGHLVDVRLYNKYGERFMQRYDPERLELTTRDKQAYAIATEIFEGRGSEHGGVYASIKHLPDNLIDYYLEFYVADKEMREEIRPLVERMKKGLALEIGEGGMHFFMGGIRINVNCETIVPGLYAAGECAGGMNGACRLSGVAFGQTQVQGARAGKNAAEYAMKAKPAEIDAEQVSKLEKRVSGYLKRTEGIRPFVLRQKIRDLARGNVGIIRDGPRLEKAVKEIERMRRDDIPRLYSEAKQTRYNLEWTEAAQVENMLLTLEMIARGALRRTESRACHHRIDYPETDDKNWLNNTIVKEVKGTMTLREEPLVITRKNFHG